MRNESEPKHNAYSNQVNKQGPICILLMDKIINRAKQNYKIRGHNFKNVKQKETNKKTKQKTNQKTKHTYINKYSVKQNKANKQNKAKQNKTKSKQIKRKPNQSKIKQLKKT